jgi:hypothetical protein
LPLICSSSVDLDFVVSSLISYITTASLKLEWFTTLGADMKNPKATTKDFSVTLLKRVRDGSWLYTGLTPQLKSKIDSALLIAEDKKVFFAKQLDQLDSLAKTILLPADLVASSNLCGVLKDLTLGVASFGSVGQREMLLNKLDSYCDSIIPALDHVENDAQKDAWIKLMYEYSANVLMFTVPDISTWDEKFGYLREFLVPRIQQFKDPLKVVILSSLANSVFKKMATGVVDLGVSGQSLQRFKQMINNFVFDVSQMSSTTLVSALFASLQDVLVAMGLKPSVLSAPSLPVAAPVVSVSKSDAVTLLESANTSPVNLPAASNSSINYDI